MLSHTTLFTNSVKSTPIPAPVVKKVKTTITFQQLVDAVLANNVSAFDEYLTQNPSLLDQDINGLTIVHVIAEYARDPKIIDCLNKHLKINNKLSLLFAEDPACNIPLLLAAKLNKEQMVLALLAIIDARKKYDAVTWINRQLENSLIAARVNPDSNVLNAIKPIALNPIPQSSEPLDEKKIELHFPEAKTNSELAKLLRYGYQIANDVSAMGTEAATDPKFNGHLQFHYRNRLIGLMRAEYDQEANKIYGLYSNPDTRTDKLLELNHRLVVKYKKTANCMELGRLCFKRAREIDPTIRIELVYIANDDHWFLVIGRSTAPTSQISDYKTWGNAVVIDLFGKAKPVYPSIDNVYPCTEIPNRLKYYYYDEFITANIVGPFNKKIHYFARDLFFDPPPTPTLATAPTPSKSHSMTLSSP